MTAMRLNRRCQFWGSALCAGFSLLSGVPYASGQIIHGQPPELQQGVTFLSWDVSGESDFTIQEWHVPVLVRAGLAENVELAVSAALMNASGDWESRDDKINGLSDSKVQVSGSLMDDQVLLSGGLSLPTGQTELSRDQQEILAWLSSDFLNFPIKNPGEGLNVFGQAGVAMPAGQWVVGASGALYFTGKYTPYDNGREYQPGSRLVGDIGTERIWPANHRLTCDLLVIYSMDDKLDGDPVFRDGVQFDARVHGVVVLGEGSLEGGVRYILRGKDRQLVSGDELVTDPSKRHGDDFRVHAAGKMPVGAALALWVSIDAKFLAANDYPEDSPYFEDAARVTGLGGGMEFALGPRSRAKVGVRGWSGSSDGAFGLGELDLSGFEVVQTLTFTF